MTFVADGNNGLEVDGAKKAPAFLDARRVARVLRRGEAAIFPTDTVAGVGVSIGAAASPKILFDLKRRDADKPIAWLVGSSAALDVYGVAVPGYARQMALAWWPGPLTLIVHASAAVPSAFRSAEKTIGLRMPACSETLDLLTRVGCPIATTSANFAGAPSPRGVAQVDLAFAAAVGVVMPDGSKPESGIASTVIDCTSPRPRILREGGITAEDVAHLLENYVL